jgi:antiviral helicase SLH1
VLEIIVSRMNYIASQKKGSVRLVGMSTACANAMDLANWLGVKEGLFNFRHSVRPVPLEIYIDGFPEIRGFCPFMQSMNRPTFLAIKSHSPEKPVIVFVASRRQTRLTARDLINFCGMEENPRRFVRMSEEDLVLNLSRAKDAAFREALGFGIGLHHAGLVESDRQLAEELFASNKIQILIATSTLAWGVNLPAHLVVVKGTQFFDAKTEGYKDMDLTDVLQMLGRAGRPQFDDSGVARIFTQDSKKAFYKHFLHTGFPVESSLHLVLSNHLAAEISAGTIATKQDALDYLTWTFFFRRLHKNPTYYGLQIRADEQNSSTAQELANEYMIDLVDSALDDLSDSSCAVIHSTGEIESTPFGKIMSYYYLSHKTIRMFQKEASRSPSFEAALSWVSLATEFDELPVRHNEDLINGELGRRLRFDPSLLALPLWDPHVKAFLLLQAHFDRIDLPITDYVGDQNSVLDQSIRICQAAIDVLAERGFLDAVKMMIRLMQCIKSARWPTDGPLSIFRGINVDRENDRVKNGKVGGKDLRWVSNAARETLRDAAVAGGLPVREVPQLASDVRHIPRLQVSVSKASNTSMSVSLVRQNVFENRGGRMFAPKFPKPQTEGYFVIVTESGKDELLALKRVGWPSGGGRPKTETTLALPPSGVGRVYSVTLMSDGYPGLEWSLQKAV